MGNMDSVLAFSTVIVVVVSALIQLIKVSVPRLPKKYVPAVAFAVGLVIGLAAYPFTDMDLTMRLWSGGIAGLSSVGFYENISRNIKK